MLLTESSTVSSSKQLDSYRLLVTGSTPSTQVYPGQATQPSAQHGTRAALPSTGSQHISPQPSQYWVLHSVLPVLLNLSPTDNQSIKTTCDTLLCSTTQTVCTSHPHGLHLALDRYAGADTGSTVARKSQHAVKTPLQLLQVCTRTLPAKEASVQAFYSLTGSVAGSVDWKRCGFRTVGGNPTRRRCKCRLRQVGHESIT